MPTLPPWIYNRPISDSTAGSLAGAVCTVALTSANFDFSLAKSDGSDLRVYDETAAALLPLWLMDYDPVAQTATLFYKATLTSHTHTLYYGNAAATAVSSFSGVFTHGSGFDADWGDLTTHVAGTGGAATRYAGPTSVNDPRNYTFWRLQESPTLSIGDLNTAGVSNPGGAYTGIREFNLLRDSQNRVVQDGGKYYITFSRRPNVNTLTIDGWRAESTSKAGPWSNFTQLYSTGSEHVNSPSSPIKVGSTYYLFVTFGWANGGGATPGLVIKLRTSTDLTTWADQGTVLSPGVFNDITSGTCDNIGNAWVIPLADGTYMMTVEGYNSANAQWSCYGATCAGPPFTSWTPLNSGNPLVSKGAGGTWDANGAANPKCFQMPDHSFVIEYNGSDDPTNLDWQLGWATAATPGGSYTKNSANPIAGHTTGTYGVETAHLSWDEDGTSYFHACQRFDTTSATAHAFFMYPEKLQGGLLLERAVDLTDAAIAGVMLDPGTFTASIRSVYLAHRTLNTSLFAISIYNSATVPTPTTAAAWATGRRLEITRSAHDTATPGDLALVYWDGSAVRHFWTGSAWTTSLTFIASDYAREIVATIQDDGTNFILSATYADDGSSIASASIVKSSVGSFSAGRALYGGEPFTDAGVGTSFYRYFLVRPYVGVEPALSLGSRSGAPTTPTTATLSGPTSGKIGVASTNFTVTLDNAALADSSFPVTYPGGAVASSPVVVLSGQTTATFTVTPSVSGASNVSIGAGTTGLAIVGSPVAYTATASTATLSGPGFGAVGTPSSAFTVTLNAVAPSGGISCPVTSSNGSDTITTSPVVIAAGNTTGTFTESAISAGSRNITLAATTPSLTVAGSPVVYFASAGPTAPSGGSTQVVFGMEIY